MLYLLEDLFKRKSEIEHYEDVENNILREKDLKRQNEIIEHLQCEYWRYNETTKCLWKAN